MTLVLLLLIAAGCSDPEQATEAPPVEQETAAEEAVTEETAPAEDTDTAALEGLTGVSETEGLDEQVEDGGEPEVGGHEQNDLAMAEVELVGSPDAIVQRVRIVSKKTAMFKSDVFVTSETIMKNVSFYAHKTL